MNYEIFFEQSFINKVLLDILLACITGIGFTNLANAPKKTILYCGILGGFGHALRFVLINVFNNFSIVIATFIASFLIGFFAIFFAQKKHVPVEVIAFPALIPMIPGIYAYKAIVSIFMFLKIEEYNAQKIRYLSEFFDYFFLTSFVVLALAVGISIVLLIFSEKVFSMTRKLNLKELYKEELTLLEQKEKENEN